MYQALLADTRFHQLLLQFDTDIAANARAAGCPDCGGVLHSARFPRKPRGLPAGLGKCYHQRLSFCCAADLCRHRNTPPSLRFLARKVYLGAIVVLVTTMLHGATTRRVQCLSQLFGISRRTIARWREWWRTVFVRKPFWIVARGRFMPPVDLQRLPASLLERFTGSTRDQLISLLRFISPTTGGARFVQAN